MQRDNRLAGTGGTGHARGAGKRSLYPITLRRMQKDRPLVPRCVQRRTQLFHIGHQTEAALRIGVLERVSGRSRWYLYELRYDDLLHPLTNLHKLCRTSFGMNFQFATLSSFISLVVVVYIAEQQIIRCFVDNHADITADTHAPEILVFGAIELVKLQPRMCRIHLEVEGCGFGGFLLVCGETSKAVRECVRNTKLHNSAKFELNPPPSLVCDLHTAFVGCIRTHKTEVSLSCFRRVQLIRHKIRQNQPNSVGG